MRQPRRRGAFAFLCLSAAAATTTTTTSRTSSFPTAVVSGFHCHASAGADGRFGRCRSGAGGDSWQSSPRQPLQQQQQQRRRRSLTSLGAGGVYQKYQRRRRGKQSAGSGLVVMSGGGDMFGRTSGGVAALHGRRRRAVFERPVGGGSAASVMRRRASADDDDDNYVSHCRVCVCLDWWGVLGGCGYVCAGVGRLSGGGVVRLVYGAAGEWISALSSVDVGSSSLSPRYLCFCRISSCSQVFCIAFSTLASHSNFSYIRGMEGRRVRWKSRTDSSLALCFGHLHLFRVVPNSPVPHLSFSFLTKCR